MAEFDVIIRGGTIIDGTRMPRYRGDVGVKAGKIAKLGNLKNHSADKVIDAEGMNVVPGFVDLHTHYDAQLFWDPYCTMSSWHGITSVVIGNCGFGFAPIKPEMRERAMLMMTRTEAIPYASMKAGMPWDWVSYPEMLDSIDRKPKGVNLLPFAPMAPIMIWAMGLEEAKSGRMPTEAEHQEMERLINEAMDAGACGWSAQRFGRNSVQADYDGTPMVTDLMKDETAVRMARVLGQRNEGFIQMSYIPDGECGNYEGDATKHSQQHYEELALAANRPILYNAVAANDAHPDRHRAQLKWLDSCVERGIRVFPQGATLEVGFVFTFKDWNLWDDMPQWREVTTGPVEDRLLKLSDPQRRPGLRDAVNSAVITNAFEDIIVLEVRDPKLKKYENQTVGEIGKAEGKHAIDAMLDIATADGLNTEFYTPPVNTRVDYLKEVVNAECTPILGVSDGGAHTKFFTGGRYSTEGIIKMCRDNHIMGLEELHWRLSAHPAMCAGFKNRGTLTEGSWADVVVYDMNKLEVKPMEILRDFPGGEWRRVQRAAGYHAVMVNGQTIFEDNNCTGATPGQLLRHGGR
ncbi:MAG TPA: amidohydrolase family protein [Candidatus Binataceae bacterium]|nr:amidohydrolase family protein [Candidatus Binataceae bacterium]